MKIPLNQVKITNRFRRDLGEIQELAQSLKKYGQIQPIILDSDQNLIAGERRFRAAQMLGWEEISFQYRDDLDELSKRELELEENVCRKDFTDKEKVEAVLEIHRLKTKKYGESSTSGGGWTLADTAKSLNISAGYVSQILTVAEGLERHPGPVKEALEKSGIYAAYKETRRQQIASVDSVLVKLKETRPTLDEAKLVEYVNQHFLLGDCLTLIKSFPEGMFHFIHTDSPYGIELRKQRDNKEAGNFASETYKDDDPEEFRSIWTALGPELYRVATKDSYALLWCAYPMIQFLIDVMSKAGWKYRNPPFTWVKINSPWSCMQPGRQFASATDCALLFAKGDPYMFKQGQPNYFLHPSMKREEVTHTLERPRAIYDYLHPIFTVPGMNILDPFAGSASCLRAAYRQGLNPYGFEKDEIYYNRAKLKWIEEMKNEPTSTK